MREYMHIQFFVNLIERKKNMRRQFVCANKNNWKKTIKWSGNLMDMDTK